MPVANDSRTSRPGASRMRWRRLTIGSSTTPVVPESARPSSASGSREAAAAAEEARAIGLPLDRPLRRPLEAQHVDRPERRLVGRRAAADGRAARRCRAGTRFRRTACRTPDARDRPARGREHDLGVARDVDLARCGRRGCAPGAAALRRRLRSRPRCRAASRCRRRAGGTSPVSGENVDRVVVRLAARSADRSPTRPRRCARRAGR